MSGLVGPVWLIGCGKMGSALAEGWLTAGLSPEALIIVEPTSSLRAGWSARSAKTLDRIDELRTAPRPEAVVLAVKPQTMPEVLSELRAVLPRCTLVVSIAAGTPIGLFKAALGSDRAIVRAMPNTPAAIGRGVTALVADAACNADDRALAETLLAAVGEVVWVDREEHMHAVTAVSGSGPAYVFLLIEAMAAAGARQGLPADLATRLAQATVAGAGELARSSALDAATLRNNVTSPGGTTAAALEVLVADESFASLVERAIAAASARSETLARAEPKS